MTRETRLSFRVDPLACKVWASLDRDEARNSRISAFLDAGLALWYLGWLIGYLFQGGLTPLGAASLSALAVVFAAAGVASWSKHKRYAASASYWQRLAERAEARETQ